MGRWLEEQWITSLEWYFRTSQVTWGLLMQSLYSLQEILNFKMKVWEIYHLSVKKI